MSSWHSESLHQLFQRLEARPGGLSSRQAEERLRRFGPNELEPPRRAGLGRRIWEQVRDPMILVLLGAAGLSLAASRGRDWLDAAIILVIVAVNGALSISQEDRAQQALEELRKLSSPQASALRGGKVTKIPAAQLVPGDVILLEAGDLVRADARILECSRKGQELLGVGHDEAVQRYIFEFIEADDIEQALLTREPVFHKKIRLNRGRIIAEETIVYIDNLDAVLVTFQDITREERIREQHYNLKVETVEMAQKVIEKQMTVAQEIAGLLGETTAETKVTLTKLRDSILNEEE